MVAGKMSELTNHCRVCGHMFFKEPLLRYSNMPKAAQFLPDEMTLPNDQGVDLEVCQCSGCGLTQLSGNPVPYYREVIRASAFSEEMRSFRLNQFENFMLEFSLKGGKVVEIGCGRGELLSLMRQCGAEARGLEYSESAVEQCVKDGLKVTRGFVEDADYKIPGGPFVAFFMMNFLEHLPDPNGVLRGIYNNITDDAVGIIEVPNFDMIVRKKLFSEFIPDHLFYFTKETLTAALRLNGFEIITCRELWYDYIISAVVKKRRRTDLAQFYDHQTKLKSDLEKHLGRFGHKKVVVWGAGHQAFALLALLNLADKIKYVVDSAPFKQGKYTPATHIPIVSPELLYADPPEAVIVMAAGYSDEVAGIVRERCGSGIAVSIVRDFGLEIV